MNIEKKKDAFLKFLRASYQAQKKVAEELYRAFAPLRALPDSFGNHSDYGKYNSEKVILEEKKLKELGFLGNDFWKVICPTLIDQGILKSYTDPDLARLAEVGDQYKHIFIVDEMLLFTNVGKTKDSQENSRVEGNSPREKIELKKLGITIQGRYIFKGLKKVALWNPAEMKLVYFLYFKACRQPEECFGIKTLAEEIDSTEGYVKNRISDINKKIKESVTLEKTSISHLIKLERSRGYRINPKILNIHKK